MLSLPTVTLCCIVKNEAQNLPVCLREAKRFDRCLVVDTGSTDGTPETAQSLGAEVVSFKWCDDFAKARNVWHEHVKSGWIFWLDADDSIDPGIVPTIFDLAFAAPEDVIAFRFNYEYPNGYKTDHFRLYRADRGIEWFRRIHEGLRLWDVTGRTLHSGLTVKHESFPQYDRDAMKARSERNIGLLLKELEDNPKSALDMQYIAMDHQSFGRHEEAAEWFQRALKCADPARDMTWLPEMYINMARSLTKLGKPGQAKDIMRRGVKDCGARAFAYFAERQLAVR